MPICVDEMLIVSPTSYQIRTEIFAEQSGLLIVGLRGDELNQSINERTKGRFNFNICPWLLALVCPANRQGGF